MARVPKTVPLPPEKMRGLPLSPVDGFILSRIDGNVTEREISTLTGLGADQVQASLDKLVSLGAITFGDAPPQVRPEPRPSNLPPLPVIEDSDVDTQGARRIPRGLYDPVELDEDVEIEVEHRRAVLDAYYTLGDLTHYELLGVGRLTDKKAIKRGYFEAASLFHPDKYFRKRLGSFKGKMEAIFARITLAHDTLTDAEQRAEYDGYLLMLDSTKQLEEQLHRQEEAAIPREEPRTPPPQPAPPVSSLPPALRSPADEQARRDSLARRLRGGRMSSPPPRTTSSPAAPSSDPEALRRYHDDRVTAIRAKLANDHATTARAAAAAGDWVGATTAFKLAISVDPSDANIRRELEEAQLKANTILGEQYKKQATYEEKSLDWQSASRSWARAARSLDKDPHCQERAAHAILRADGGNLHEARTYAQKAVELDPKKVIYRTTLAEVYLAAGLILNARRELEAAAQMAENDAASTERIQALLKKVAKAK